MLSPFYKYQRIANGPSLTTSFATVEDFMIEFPYPVSGIFVAKISVGSNNNGVGDADITTRVSCVGYSTLPDVVISSSTTRATNSMIIQGTWNISNRTFAVVKLEAKASTGTTSFIDSGKTAASLILYPYV